MAVSRKAMVHFFITFEEIMTLLQPVVVSTDLLRVRVQCLILDDWRKTHC